MAATVHTCPETPERITFKSVRFSRKRRRYYRFNCVGWCVTDVLGYLLFYVFFAVFASLENISPWYSLVCSIPVYVTGGGASYLTVLLCYITDVTREANRGMRMGVFEAVLSLGILMGNVSSSYVFSVTNYLGTFLISATCCFLNVIFTVFLIPESLINPETEVLLLRRV
jgi:predicted MFS family arabinose efflux permease